MIARNSATLGADVDGPGSLAALEVLAPAPVLFLSGPPRQVRQTLAEVEAHLHDAVAEAMAAGLGGHEAQLAAVQRIGPAHAVSGRTALFASPATALARRTALTGSLVAGVALVAVGLSGAIAWALAAIGGGQFVTAPFPPGSYSRADCVRWLAGDPGTHSCVTAMGADHVGDILLSSFAAGILGLVTLLAFWLMRRRWQDRGTLTARPSAVPKPPARSWPRSSWCSCSGARSTWRWCSAG
jgi:hypothetical protein